MGPYVSRALGFEQPQPQPTSRQERREQARQERRKTEREARAALQQPQQPPPTQGDETQVPDLWVSTDIPYGTLPLAKRECRIAMLLELHGRGTLGSEECLTKMNVRREDKPLFMSDIRSIYNDYVVHLEGKRPGKADQIRVKWLKKILRET